jgi:hypothetical protein
VGCEQGGQEDGLRLGYWFGGYFQVSTLRLGGEICLWKFKLGIFFVWMERVWTPYLGYVPEVYYLMKVWMGFLCNTPEDVALLLENNWVNGGSSLMLKRWWVAFDPITEYFSFRHFWVLLPGYPYIFGSKGHWRPLEILLASSL